MLRRIFLCFPLALLGISKRFTGQQGSSEQVMFDELDHWKKRALAAERNLHWTVAMMDEATRYIRLHKQNGDEVELKRATATLTLYSPPYVYPDAYTICPVESAKRELPVFPDSHSQEQ